MSLFSIIGKFLSFRGLSRFSVDFFCLTVPKTSLSNPSVLCFRTFPVTKKIMDKRVGGGYGGFKIFR